VAHAWELLQYPYKNLEGPCVLPGYMFDFWAIPYLTGKGFDTGQIKEFTRIAQGMLIRSFDETNPDFSREEEMLRSGFSPVRRCEETLRS